MTNSERMVQSMNASNELIAKLRARVTELEAQNGRYRNAVRDLYDAAEADIDASELGKNVLPLLTTLAELRQEICETGW